MRQAVTILSLNNHSKINFTEAKVVNRQQMSKSSEIYFNSTIAFIASKQKLQSHELLSLYLNSICSISLSVYQRNKPYSEMKNVAIKIVQ